jgi:hypothetical protein
MVPEAKLKETDAGLVPASTGWFVMNARDARWCHRPDCPDIETQDGEIAYANVPPSRETRYRDGVLPE